MLDLHPPLDLIRYLFVLEVNARMVLLPVWPAMELSLLLSGHIADRLPVVAARPWKKTLAAWQSTRERGNSSRSKKPLYSARPGPWPVDAVIFWYPVKSSYGKGECILFELKLIGDGADHDLFLEAILPAMEEIGMVPQHRPGKSKKSYPLWGHFDIRSVYSARGASWKPLVKNGKLDLRRKVNAGQWAMGLKPGCLLSPGLQQLTWLSPFLSPASTPKGKKIMAPTLYHILEAVAERIGSIMPGKHVTAADLVEVLGKKSCAALLQALVAAQQIPIAGHKLKATPHPFPGMIQGKQRFARQMPQEIIPFLELGAILHIGQHTHFGCGAFMLR